MNRVFLNNFSNSNYDDHFQTNLVNAGMIMRKKQTIEIEQNKDMFQYYMPRIQHNPCIDIGMRPQETKHSILGNNVCDNLRNTFANPNMNDVPLMSMSDTCHIDPFIPSWRKYIYGINNESDLKNIIRKKSCDPDSQYIPSTSSTMYSKGGMPTRDSTIESGYYNFQYHAERNIIPSLFREDTRQTRMGKI